MQSPVNTMNAVCMVFIRSSGLAEAREAVPIYAPTITVTRDMLDVWPRDLMVASMEDATL